MLTFLSAATGALLPFLSLRDVCALRESCATAADAVRLLPDWLSCCGNGKVVLLARSLHGLRKLLAVSPGARLRSVRVCIDDDEPGTAVLSSPHGVDYLELEFSKHSRFSLGGLLLRVLRLDCNYDVPQKLLISLDWAAIGATLHELDVRNTPYYRGGGLTFGSSLRASLSLLPNLRKLSARLTSAPAESVGLPPLLEELELSDTELDAAMFAPLAALRVLTLNSCWRIGSASGMVAQLTELEIACSVTRGDDVFVGAEEAPNLTMLSMDNDKHGAGTVSVLPLRAPRLLQLHLGDVEAAALSRLEAPLLQKLFLFPGSDAIIGDDVLAACANFPSLRELDLPAEASFTRAGFAALADGAASLTNLASHTSMGDADPSWNLTALSPLLPRLACIDLYISDIRASNSIARLMRQTAPTLCRASLRFGAPITDRDAWSEVLRLHPQQLLNLVCELTVSGFAPSAVLTCPLPSLRELTLSLYHTEAWTSREAWTAVGSLPLLSLKVTLQLSSSSSWPSGELDRIACALAGSHAATTLRCLCFEDTSRGSSAVGLRSYLLSDVCLAFIPKFGALQSVTLKAQGCTRRGWMELSDTLEERGAALHPSACDWQIDTPFLFHDEGHDVRVAEMAEHAAKLWG